MSTYLERDLPPNCKFPEFSRTLRLSQYHQRLAYRKKPRISINYRRISGLRISISNDRGIVIFPEFRYQDEWYQFFIGKDSLATRIHQISIGGHVLTKASTTSYLSNTKLDMEIKYWKRWLKKWQKMNRVKAPFIEDESKEEVKEERVVKRVAPAPTEERVQINIPVSSALLQETLTTLDGVDFL